MKSRRVLITLRKANPSPLYRLRVPESLVAKVDALRKQRTGKISRNTWILEAIEDKVVREMA